MSAAKPQYEKSTGNWMSAMKVSATRMRPPVAKGRAPKRSARMPLTGPASRRPTVSGIEILGALVAVALLAYLAAALLKPEWFS